MSQHCERDMKNTRRRPMSSFSIQAFFALFPRPPFSAPGRVGTRPRNLRFRLLGMFLGTLRKPAQEKFLGIVPFIGNGQEVCFGPSRPDPERNARDQDGTRTGRGGPHLGTWMGPKRCQTKHMANLDGTASDPGWDLDRPGIGPR